MYTSYQYTKNVGSLFQHSVSQAKTFYGREDFDVILKRYKKAPADSKVFIKRELDDMCKARGLESWVLLRDPKVLETIPTRAEILDHLIDTFYALRKDVPSAHDYMKRIVHQLASEYDRDPVRVAILKKYVLGAGQDCKIYDTSSIIAWVLDKMEESERVQFDSADEQTQIEIVVNKLDDSIFKSGLTISELTWRDVLVLIKKRENLLRNEKRKDESKEQQEQNCSESDQNKKAAKVITVEGKEVAYPAFTLNCQTISEELRTYLGLSKKAEISCVEIIDLLINKIDQGLLHTDSQQAALADKDMPSDKVLTDFSLALEKQFRKHLNQFTYRTKKGSTAKLAEKYKDDRKYAKEQKQTGNWSLLTLCEDLANGAFKTNNRQTRVNLYHFAIMFDMTIALQVTDIYDPQRDLRKNLFEDYYCDNLVRYLGQSPLDLAESSGWEKEPSGEGINLKNYAEAIYIYYIYRRDLKLTPGQRIMHAENAIQYCKNAPPSKATKLSTDAYTQYYAEQFVDFILNANEKDLTKLIVDYYDIRGTGATPIQKAAQQNTASEFVTESLTYLDDGREADYALDTISKDREDQINEIAEATSIFFDWRILSLLKERYREDADFIRLLSKLEWRLTKELDWVSGREKAVLALTLQALYHNTSSTSPIKLQKLKDIVQENDPSINQSSIIESAAKTLRDIGFDVQKLSGNEESVICWHAIAPILKAYKSFSNVARFEAIQEMITQEANKSGQGVVLKHIDAERIRAYATHLADKKVVTFAGSPTDLLICWNLTNSGNLKNSIPFEESLSYSIAIKLFDEISSIDKEQHHSYPEETDVRKAIKKHFEKMQIGGEFHFIPHDDLVKLIQVQLPNVALCNIVACITSMVESGCFVLKTIKYNQYICWSASFENNHSVALRAVKDEEESFSELFYKAMQNASDACSVIASPDNKKIVDALLKCENDRSTVRLSTLLHELRKTEPSANEDAVISRVNRLKVLGMPIDIQGNYETLISWNSGWNDLEIGDIFPNEFTQQQDIFNRLVHCLQLIREKTSTRIISVDLKTLYAKLQQEIPDVEAHQLFKGVKYLIDKGLQAHIDEETFIWTRSYYDDMTFKGATEQLVANAPTEKAFKESLLMAMRICANGRHVVRACKLAEYFSENGKEENTGKILEATKKLVIPGSGIYKLGSDDSLLYLGVHKYSNDKLNCIIKKVETRYEPDIAGLRQMFTEMLAGREPSGRNITRTTVLSICLSHYVEMLQETDGISSFPDLYDDFAAYVNPILEDCRFQPLHEKNILDMYIILSLFFYVAENGKE